VLAAKGVGPFVLLSTSLPRRGSEPDRALRAGADAFFDAFELRPDADVERLRVYAKGGHTTTAEPGFWSPAELSRHRAR
jgi:hypothetical protein